MKACSPFHGDLSSKFRGYPGHNGTDIRPEVRYSYGNPVAAMLPGTVVDLVRHQKEGDKDNGIGRSYDIGFMTGNGVAIENADGEHQIFNHCLPVASLKIGDKVVAGQIIAHNDKSGNQTGAHIHMEYRRKNAKGIYAPVDAQYLFDKYDIKVGDPISVTSKPVAVKPKPAKPWVKRYVTVKLGSRNSTVGRVQKALRTKGYTQQIVDNYFGKDQTEFNVRHFQRNNGLFEDGIAAEKTQRKLGI